LQQDVFQQADYVSAKAYKNYYQYPTVAEYKTGKGEFAQDKK